MAALHLKFTKLLSSQWLVVGLLGLILALALFLRIYQIDKVPPALSWDEVSVGYNAYAIANWTRDEYGKSWPMTFKSFGDDKSPVHVYFTALAVKLFGPSEFSVRLMPAIFGTLSVLMLYLVIVEMFGNRWMGLIGAGLLAISPYNLQFSRFNHEACFALFFFLFGLWMFYKGIKDGFWLPFAAVGFGLSLLSYHSSKVVVPLTLILLFGLYFKQLLKYKIGSVLMILILVGFGMLYRFNPDLLGTARLEQASIPLSVIESLPSFKAVSTSQTAIPASYAELVGRADLAIQRYLVYFQPEYLFITGDKIERHSTGKVGQFYLIEAIFLILGVGFLIVRRSKEAIAVLAMALIAPLPAAIAGGFSETGHAARALFTMASWTIVIAAGIYGLIKVVKYRPVQIGVGVIIVCLYGWLFWSYLVDYYQKYPTRSANEWQYGYKQVVEYVKAHPEYNLVYMTEIRSQPYAFFLFYLDYPLTDYLREVEYNPTDQRPHNNVYSFNKYHFGDWDEIRSMPTKGVLYVVEPAIYDGLAHKKDFEIKELVKYPNGNPAFYLVAGDK